jgi:hypothetical protein
MAGPKKTTGRIENAQDKLAGPKVAPRKKKKRKKLKSKDFNKSLEQRLNLSGS